MPVPKFTNGQKIRFAKSNGFVAGTIFNWDATIGYVLHMFNDQTSELKQHIMDEMTLEFYHIPD